MTECPRCNKNVEDWSSPQSHPIEGTDPAQYCNDMRAVLGEMIGVFAGGGLLSPSQVDRVRRADPGWGPIPQRKEMM